MKPKNQRLVLVSAAIVAVLVAVLLAMWGLRDKASYFYTPSDLKGAEVGKSIRLGGMVEKGSLVHNDSLTIQFAVTDGKALDARQGHHIDLLRVDLRLGRDDFQCQRGSHGFAGEPGGPGKARRFSLQ